MGVLEVHLREQAEAEEVLALRDEEGGRELEEEDWGARLKTFGGKGIGGV